MDGEKKRHTWVSSCHTWSSKDFSSYLPEYAVKWHGGSSQAVEFWKDHVAPICFPRMVLYHLVSSKYSSKHGDLADTYRYYVTMYIYVSIPSFCNTSQWFPSPQSFLCFLFSIISHPPIGRFNTRFGTTELQGDAAKHGGPQQSCYLNETAGQQILVNLRHLKQKIQ